MRASQIIHDMKLWVEVSGGDPEVAFRVDGKLVHVYGTASSGIYNDDEMLELRKRALDNWLKYGGELKDVNNPKVVEFLGHDHA